MSKNKETPPASSRVAKRKTKGSRWKKISLITGCILAALLIGSGAYAYHLYHSVQTAANKMYHPVKDKSKTSNKKTPSKVQMPKKNGQSQPISILLMGVDQRPNDPGRSDTLIVLTLNPQSKEMQMVSIPRDTKIQLPGYGTQKINAAYAFGGPKLAMQTVKKYLNIPLDYYVRINMQGLSQLVDAVGGVTVDNNISWHDEGFYKKGYFYHKGTLHLNGPQALGYVRMRHLDPRGDFGRNQRQRKVIRAIVHNASGFSSFSHYQDILDAISNNVITDMTFADMKSIVVNYRDCKKNIKSYEVKSTPKRIGRLDYVIASNQEIQKMHNLIMNQLQGDQSSSTTNQSNSEDAKSH